jgi:isopentenyl-diphosphate Delta-isomerase
MEQVILVNEQDEPLGLMEKMEAHEKGILHRAFSVFLFNDRHQLLLQKRALTKYHSGGLWTNTCCSHPRENEEVLDAGNRRLREEMGIQSQLTNVFSFVYRAELDNNLIEHELDHVLVGTFNDTPQPNPEEVMDWKYIDLEEIRKNEQ